MGGKVRVYPSHRRLRSDPTSDEARTTLSRTPGRFESGGSIWSGWRCRVGSPPHPIPCHQCAGSSAVAKLRVQQAGCSVLTGRSRRRQDRRAFLGELRLRFHPTGDYPSNLIRVIPAQGKVPVSLDWPCHRTIGCRVDPAAYIGPNGN